ncbi:MAG: 4-(cytidine 5'-diphospho)-2-C-methyl-D-erythritol kinase, partial [Planctomycetes bacterium]|nr:4-(cytidine 5'-diphospho)-2-C-methyl-D-erythritol kinase [Planctomycetota bacterium]
MPSITLAAPAKINLALEILGRRADGYHAIETVFQTLELCDRVTISLGDGPEPLRLTCSDPTLPAEGGNLAWKAAAAVRARISGFPSIAVDLVKRVPHGAGLGGGSSDAAAVLRGLARLDPRVAALDLAAIAADLGSDVPFFLVGGSAHATGRGEELTPLPDAPMSAITVLMPAAELPTPAVYRELTDAERGPRPLVGSARWRDRLAAGPVHSLASNRLTAPARRLCPAVAALLDHLET